jgi:DNA-binding transcriptional MerR regulator
LCSVRSSEVARLADTTVRALRHYHHVGVLAEPPRDDNGYRNYRVGDLVQVLRIKRLAALGIPLERMHDMLNEPGTSSDVLDELDLELERRIGDLQLQRTLLATVRSTGVAPDLPAAAAQFMRLVYEPGDHGRVAELDRGMFLMLDQVTAGGASEELVKIYERTTHPTDLEALRELNRRFDTLEEGDHGEQAKIELTAALVHALRPFVAAVLREEPIRDATSDGLLGDLMTSHQKETLSEDQLDVLGRVISELTPAVE